jgi:hypothetical protein
MSELHDLYTISIEEDFNYEHYLAQLNINLSESIEAFTDVDPMLVAQLILDRDKRYAEHLSKCLEVLLQDHYIQNVGELL